MNVRLATALLLIVLPIVFIAINLLLRKTFEYPDILRKPAGEILNRFNSGGSRLVGLWYAYTLTALLFVPVGVLLPRLLVPDNPAFFGMMATLGVLAGLTQALGLMRWSFLVPHLTRLYTRPEASQTSREAVEVTFQAFHRYLGVALGEHLGYLITSGWTALIAYRIILRSQITWFGWIGLLIALGILAGALEPVGFKPAGKVNAIAYLLWSLWLVALGVILLM